MKRICTPRSQKRDRNVTIKISRLLFPRYAIHINYDIDRDSMQYVNNQVFYYGIMTSIDTRCDM